MAAGKSVSNMALAEFIHEVKHRHGFDAPVKSVMEILRSNRLQARARPVHLGSDFMPSMCACRSHGS